MKSSPLILILFFIFCTSCSHFKKKGSWGNRAYQSFSWQHVKQSFVKNVKSPHVWAPAAGAIIVRSTGWDRSIGEFFQNKNVFYDKKKEANTYSDTLNTILEVEMWTSGIFTNSWEEDGDWGKFAFHKAKGASVMYLTKSLSNSSTKQLKYATKRERPDGSDKMSFPSGHATATGTYRMIISRNLKSTDIDPKVKRYINGANGIVSAASVWSRIEGGSHFPSDALAGYAIGSFVSGFVYDILMNVEDGETFAAVPMKDNGFMAQYALRF
jgi:hypothetical protein